MRLSDFRKFLRLKWWQQILVLVLTAVVILSYSFTPNPDSSVSTSVTIATPQPTSSGQVAGATDKPTYIATPSATPIANNQIYTVSRVIDGDTIEVSHDGITQKVRLIGIDTPETVDPRRSPQCFGKEASEYTKSLLINTQVTLEKDVSETDRYGRLLRYVYKDGVMINEQLVATGYAQAKSYPPDVKYQEIFRTAEAQARVKQLGLWSPTVCPYTTPNPNINP